MKRRILALFLCLVTIFSAFSFTAFAAENDADVKSVNVYVTVSKNGKIVSDEDGNLIALYSLLLDGKEKYNLDDVFRKVHDELYEGGAETGYESQEGQYGLYITKFWSDNSGKYGYQVNFGKDSVMGLSHNVKDGDYVDVCIYENYYPDTENYTRFDKAKYECYVGEDLQLTLEKSGYDDNWNTVFSPLSDATITVDGNKTQFTSDSEGKCSVSFDKAGEYVLSASKTKTVGDEEKEVTAITAPVSIVKVKELPDAVITLPDESELFVGTKPGNKHYVYFAETEPALKKENGDGTASYYFELKNNQEYNYRITSDDYMTYGGLFTKKSSKVDITVDEEALSAGGKGKTYIDRNTSSNLGYNVADIYLNINEKGYLKLSKGEKFQIVNLRNWEATNSPTANYFIEPDYHYEVIDEYGNESECVVVDDNGTITAKKNGVAFVLVTYDAINLNFGKGSDVYGAIWPENTGVFVVSVSDSKKDGIEVEMPINEGKNDSDIKLSGDMLDSEHDVIYFVESEGKYTFDPDGKDVKVYVNSPVISSDSVTYEGFEEVEKNEDGKYDIPLKHGRNIVKVSDGENESYQVITAKKVNVVINNGESVHRGDKINIAFDKLYHPSNKLAGVYNMSATAMYTNVSGYEGKLVGGLSSQYNFANSANAQTVASVLKKGDYWGSVTFLKETDFVVPEDYEYDTLNLYGGVICVSGFGDPYGNHRTITYENGKGVNTNAKSKLAYLGTLPDISIPITVTDSPLDKIELEGNDVKTKYYAGDSFDTDSITLIAVYEDGTRQKATNFTVSPSVLTKDTKSVTVTYRKKTLEIPVEVVVAKVKEIKITSQPDKTDYKVGNTFDPTGLCVTAYYENGKSKETNEYTYSPNRTLTQEDTEIVITYTGEDAVESIAQVTVPITVSKPSSTGSTTKNIEVYFTLYGDSKHGTSGTAHTLVDGNLQEWIPRTKLTLEKNSYVLDALHNALSVAGIPYQAEVNYISSIRGLAEFDNGDNSGWMYTLNGRYPTRGVSEQKLKSGDVIVFHYTDDYTKEETSFSTGTTGTGGATEKTFTVSFETNGGGKLESQTVSKNDKVSKPADPTKDGFKFVDWYTNSSFETAYDFSSKVTKDITLYAKWEKTDDEKEDENATGEEKKDFSFDDVPENMWYYDAVKYVFSKNLMLGTDRGFEPMSNMTRAMLVTVLYRMDEGNVTIKESPFDDVNEDKWFFEAVLWAYETNIVNGIDKVTFAPDDNVTREQVASILYRFAKKDGLVSDSKKEEITFADFEQISPWALEAVTWANENGIICGDEENRFLPQKSATRAEIATMLMRFSQTLKK